MRTVRLAVATAALGAALALPAAADAKLPSFSSATFVANAGFGGAKLSQSRAAATHAWGGASRGRCMDFDCGYADDKHPQLGSADLGFEDGRRGKVSKLVISAGLDVRTGRLEYDSPLAKVKGAGGVHLGSSERAVRAAYPKAKAVPGETTYIALRGRHRFQTYFSFTRGRLFQILIEDGRPRG